MHFDSDSIPFPLALCLTGLVIDRVADGTAHEYGSSSRHLRTSVLRPGMKNGISGQFSGDRHRVFHVSAPSSGMHLSELKLCFSGILLARKSPEAE